jgi:hypothetical protein
MLRSGDYIVLSVFLFPAPVADQGEGQTVAGIDDRTVSPASVDCEREGQVFIDWPVVQRQVGVAPKLGGRGHHMSHPAGNHEHIAGLEAEWRFRPSLGPSPAGTRQYGMKGNDAFGARHDTGGYPLDARGGTAPRGTCVDVEEYRTAQANRAENVRQHIHGMPPRRIVFSLAIHG